MNKSELIEKTALELGMSKGAAGKAVETIIAIIAGQLRQPGREVYIRGFGKFKSKYVPARQGRNPRTGLPCMFAPQHKVTFRASKVSE